MVREIRPRVAGKRIVHASLSHADVLRGVSRRSLVAGLRGARIESVSRRAKHAVFDTGHRRLVVQPGMTGNLMAIRRALRPEERDHAVLRAELEGGGTLVFRDVRRLGTLRWLDPAGWRAYETRLGPEPLAPTFVPEVLAAILKRSRAPVKKVLMDQTALAGVGNIYANEALFAAGIDPSKPAREVSGRAAARLHAALVRILGEAIRSRGTTVRDYRTGTGEIGGFQHALLVYEREGERCVRCGTTLAGTHAIDARITIFCHRCQS